MVVGVEKGQGLLLEEEEDGVDELDVLVEVVQLQSVSSDLSALVIASLA